MTIGLIGRKAGMTRVFTDAGESIPVTVIQALPNRVTQVKGVEGDGYRAIQVTFGSRKPSRLTRSLAGHYAKAKVEPGESLVEFRLADGEGADLATGAELKVDMFAAGQKVDVTGTTIGKGFAGTMKRHNFAGGPASHGASVFHRAPGSIGQRQTPGRVFPGKRMSGHMGDLRRTIEEPARRRDRHRTQPAADPRRGAGLAGWRSHRAPVAEGRASRQAQDAGPEAAGREDQEVTSHGYATQTAERRCRRQHRSVRKDFRPRIQRSAGAPGRHCLHGGARVPAPSARRARPRSVAVVASHTTRRAAVAPVPAPSAARSGSAVAARSLRARATTRRRSIARCIAAPSARCCPSWPASIA